MNEIWNGERMRNIRKDMLAGNRVKHCRRCYEIEEAGGVSKRLKANVEHSHLLKTAKRATGIDGSYGSFESLEYLELRFSNICNFRCRTCGPEFSTAWTKEAVALGYPKEKAGLLVPAESERLFQMLVPLLPTLKKIYFVGGEPLATPENYKVCDLLIEKGRSDIVLTYDTNFSKLEHGEKSALKQWKFFEYVEVCASLDGFAKQGEYIRKGLSWLTFLENRQRLHSQCPHVHFRLKTTVSILNAFHVLDLLKTLIESDLVEADGWYANLVSSPKRYCIRALPEDYKKKLEDDYNEFISQFVIPTLGKDRSLNIIHQLQKILRFSKGAGHPEDLNSFVRITKTLDRMRRENFLELFPEYRGLYQTKHSESQRAPETPQKNSLSV